MRTIDIDLSPEQYSVHELLVQTVAHHIGVSSSDVSEVVVLRRSLDSRRGIRYHASLQVWMKGETRQTIDFSGHYLDCHNAPSVVIVGAGPAGIFAALRALQKGLCPIIVERGKSVDERKRDLPQIIQQNKVNPNSNWCFGEGGAGTYSDGKLYTRSTKRGNINDVLYRFVEHGADPSILIDAHAHIGTDRLSPIIAAMRRTILQYGGEYRFDTLVTDLLIKQGRVVGVETAAGETIEGIGVILATGHSARDIYNIFFRHGWLLEAKPFALGVRVEHPQSVIDSIQYHAPQRPQYLPPAAYSLTAQVQGHGVFSFCMCPGGIIVPAATDANQQVVNGMSNSHRNSHYANSGIAVTVSPADAPQYEKYGPLALMHFQQDIERRAFMAANNTTNAPAQRLTDFCRGKGATSLNLSNYMGRVVPVPLADVLPDFVTSCLREAFPVFDRKMHGFYTSQANLLAVESRTSSPIRIVRGTDMQHPQLRGLFPCGEGAGYAGGIVSSAMDGINCVDALWVSINN